MKGIFSRTSNFEIKVVYFLNIYSLCVEINLRFYVDQLKILGHDGT